MTKKMIQGATSSGFSFEINPLILDDFELFEMMTEIEENPLVFVPLLNRLLGKEQKRALYDHVREEDGRVPIEALTKEVLDIIQEGGAGLKNVSSSSG